MLHLHEKEKVVIDLHRHWIVVASKLSAVVLLLIIPFIAIIVAPALEVERGVMLLIFYIISVYMMIVLSTAFIIWFDYYLDIWIITNQRIIDVEQMGMFRREVSEFMLSRVQDVTIEIPSFVATLLHYGNIRVQTAGQQSFTARDIPNPDKIKNIILAKAKLSRELYRAQNN